MHICEECNKKRCTFAFGYNVSKCSLFEPIPKTTPFAAVDAFLREIPNSEAKHNWSDYGIQEACHAVNGEACEAVTAAQHYKEGRDTLQHVLEELEHTGSTLIRAWMLVKGRLGE